MQVPGRPLLAQSETGGGGGGGAGSLLEMQVPGRPAALSESGGGGSWDVPFLNRETEHKQV